MRKNSINQITLYQSIGALLNFLLISVLLNLDIQYVDFILTVFCANVGYVMVARDISIKHEQLSEKKHLHE